MLALGALATVPRAARAQEPSSDRWLAPDKGVHFGVSAALALGGWAVGIPLFDQRPPRFVLGATVAVTAGIAKELYDWTGRGDPSWRDFTWDLLGTGAGLLIAWVLDVLLVGERSPPEPVAAAPLTRP